MTAQRIKCGFGLFGRAWLAPVLLFALLLPAVGQAEEYGNALKGVKQISAVFDVSQGNPKMANLVFWAVKNSYEDATVQALPGKTAVAVVFHGPVVKLLSTDPGRFEKEDWPEVEKFQNTLRQMKQDGVNLEVCMYAVKVVGVPPETLLKEVAQVPNGFVSVIGYQEQGYAVVRIP